MTIYHLKWKFVLAMGLTLEFLMIFNIITLAGNFGLTGVGIDPSLDYVNNGDEYIELISLSCRIKSEVYSVSDNTNFPLVISRVSSDLWSPFRIGHHWVLSFNTPYYNWNKQVLVQDGKFSRYMNSHSNLTRVDEGWTVLAYKDTDTEKDWRIKHIVLKDGTTIDTAFDYSYQIVTDIKGNWVKYGFTPMDSNNPSTSARLTSLTDSFGRYFRFSYTYVGVGSQDEDDFALTKAEQKLSDGTFKTILSLTVNGAEQSINSFTDAVNRTTTYYYVKKQYSGYYLDSIVYPNGSKTQLGYGVDDYYYYVKDYAHYYHQSDNTPYQYFTYTYTSESRTVNEENRKTTYYFAPSNYGVYCVKKETTDLSGKLLERETTDYYKFESESGGFVCRPHVVTNQLCRANGTLGSSSTFKYLYDDWGNITMVEDPMGTVTYAAYSNTNSEKNFSNSESALPLTFTLDNLSISENPDGYILNANAPWGPTYTAATTVTIGKNDVGSIKFSITYFNHYIFKIDGKIMSEENTLMDLAYPTFNTFSTTLSPGTHLLEWVVETEITRSWYFQVGITYGITLPSSFCEINVTAQQKRSNYQNYLYNSQLSTYSNIGHDKLLTKATLINDPVHNTTQLNQIHYQYDSSGNLITESKVYNGGYLDTCYTYDKYGNMTSITDANDNKLCFEYSDIYKNLYLTKVTNTSGKTIATCEYDIDTGNKTIATDPKGNIFRYEYDAVGRLTKEYLDNANSKVGITHILKYDDTNNAVTLKYGNDTVGYQANWIDYDPLFGKPAKLYKYQGLVQKDTNLVASASNWALQKQFAYDAYGRLAWEKDGMEHQTIYQYDPLDRRTQITQPDSSTTQFAYDDRVVVTTDAKGNKKEQTYDLLDRLISVKESPDKGTTSYTTTYTYDTFYDNSGDKPAYHLVKVVNPKNAATTNTYDNLGRLIRSDYPQDGLNPMAAEVFTYDNVGNIKTKTNEKGAKTLDYEYFAGYRLKTVTEPDGRKISYTYDNNDNPLTQTTNGVTYTYAYDARNRVTDLTARLDGNSFLTKYDYDTFGRVTGITYPGRINPVTYTYDELDRLQTIAGFVNSCSYDLDSKLTQMIYNNGMVNTYTYDQNDRSKTIDYGNLLNLTYDYDPVGNIIQINSDSYDYDGLNRLTWYGNQAKTNGTQWSYDGAGNITGKATYRNGASQGNISFNYDLANRLWTMGTTTYNNDSAGARTAKVKNGDTWSYIYDGESRLTKVTKNAATQVESAYDGAGMRYKKVENGKTTYYIYNGPNPLVEYTPTDGKYTYRIYAGKQAVAEEKGGVVKYFHKDHLGSTRIVTDASGKKSAEYKYAPYGEKEISSGTGTDYQFTDKANDESTGLTYFGARFYDPEVGRFITVDPARQGLNWYSYCGNNPLKYVDPDGKYYENTLTWAGTGWVFTLTDGPAPVGDAIYAGGLVFTAVGDTLYLFSDKIVSGINSLMKNAEAAKNGAEAGGKGGQANNSGRNKPDPTKHSKQRGTEGRPTGKIVNDIQNARTKDVLVQDNGNIIVRGSNGRVHVLSSDGTRHITTLTRTDANVKSLIEQGRYTYATEEQAQAVIEMYK